MSRTIHVRAEPPRRVTTGTDSPETDLNYEMHYNTFSATSLIGSAKFKRITRTSAPHPRFHAYDSDKINFI